MGCKMHEVSSVEELHQRLKVLKMKKDDLSASTYTQYVDEWKWELRCAGEEIVINDKKIASLFINGLKPESFSNGVRLIGATDFNDARKKSWNRLVEFRKSRDLLAAVSKTEDKLSIGGRKDYRNPRSEKESETNGGATRTEDYKKTFVKDKSLIRCNKCLKLGHYARECPLVVLPPVKENSTSGGGTKQTNKRLSMVQLDMKQSIANDNKNHREMTSGDTQDQLFRSNAQIIGKQADLDSIQLKTKILFDSGANFDTISRRHLSELQEQGLMVDTIPGTPFKVILAANQETMVAGTYVKLVISIQSVMSKLEVERKLLIIDDTTEDIGFGINTLRELDLIPLMIEVKKDIELVGDTADIPETHLLNKMRNF
jgi:hypothetical protein